MKLEQRPKLNIKNGTYIKTTSGLGEAGANVDCLPEMGMYRITAETWRDKKGNNRICLLKSEQISRTRIMLDFKTRTEEELSPPRLIYDNTGRSGEL